MTAIRLVSFRVNVKPEIEKAAEEYASTANLDVACDVSRAMYNKVSASDFIAGANHVLAKLEAAGVIEALDLPAGFIKYITGGLDNSFSKGSRAAEMQTAMEEVYRKSKLASDKWREGVL